MGFLQSFEFVGVFYREFGLATASSDGMAKGSSNLCIWSPLLRGIHGYLKSPCNMMGCFTTPATER